MLKIKITYLTIQFLKVVFIHCCIFHNDINSVIKVHPL
jgi:hypothetical protein